MGATLYAPGKSSFHTKDPPTPNLFMLEKFRELVLVRGQILGLGRDCQSSD